MSFQETLIELMDERGLKQVDLCELTGLSSAQVNHLVTGKTKDPKLSTALVVAKALKVSLDFLAGRDDACHPLSYDEQELVRCFGESTPQRKRALLISARDSAAMSKEAAKRDTREADAV